MRTFHLAVTIVIVLTADIAIADEFGFIVHGLKNNGYEISAMSVEGGGRLMTIKKFVCGDVFSYNDPFRNAKVFDCDGREIYFKRNGHRYNLVEIPVLFDGEGVSSIK